jgi:hypothetical protein
MLSSKFVFRILCGLLAIASPASAQTAPQNRIQLTLDTSEADQVLAILALRQADKTVPAENWQKLFSTAPYQRLKEREKKIGEQFHDPSVAFSDEDFKKFVLSDELLRRAPQLKATLERWKQADLTHSAEHVLAYLPEDAVIRAKVYPIIKPGVNSFVWELTTDPTIFLYLDSDVTREKFENIVDHELHHIGLGSLGPIYSQKIARLPQGARAVADWMEPFGEGLAMLAAAGAPDVDPHAASTPKEHARWEAELNSFNTDLPTVNNFYLDILNGKLADNDAIEAKGTSFFGSHQGPWYTVGYKMAVMVEKRYGRAVLIRTMLDFRCLLALYNQVAKEENAAGQQHLPLWSDEVLSQVEAGTCGVDSASKP